MIYNFNLKNCCLLFIHAFRIGMFMLVFKNFDSKTIFSIRKSINAVSLEDQTYSENTSFVLTWLIEYVFCRIYFFLYI